MKLYNINDPDCPKNATYIGRGTKWGNPFKIGEHGTRNEVIALYEEYLKISGLINDIHELEGKDLVCHCSPLPCHGDILIKYADEGILKFLEK